MSSADGSSSATRTAIAGAALPTGGSGTSTDQPVQIAFPPDRSEVEVMDADQPVVLKAEGGALPLTWLADGAPIEADGNAREIEWTPKTRGFVRLSVIDAHGCADRVTFRLR